MDEVDPKNGWKKSFPRRLRWLTVPIGIPKGRNERRGYSVAEPTTYLLKPKGTAGLGCDAEVCCSFSLSLWRGCRRREGSSSLSLALSLFLIPQAKRSSWQQTAGRTRNWLSYHGDKRLCKISTMSQSDRGGIQALLAAEQDAQHIVANARAGKHHSSFLFSHYA
jgi:hypothetical protein